MPYRDPCPEFEGENSGDSSQGTERAIRFQKEVTFYLNLPKPIILVGFSL